MFMAVEVSRHWKGEIPHSDGRNLLNKMISQSFFKLIASLTGEIINNSCGDG